MLAVSILILAVASVIVAGDMDQISNQLGRLFSGTFTYCNHTPSHAAACLIAIGLFIIIPFLLVLSLVSFLIVQLLKDVRQTLAKIFQEGKLKPKNNSIPETDQPPTKKDSRSFWRALQTKFQLRPHSGYTYVNDFENSFLSPWRYILFLFWFVVCFALVLIIADQAGFPNLLVSDFLVLQLVAFIFVTIFPIIVAYLIASWTWIFLVIGLYLYWIPQIFKIHVLPWHIDGCGGFKKLGDLSFKIALIISLPAILFGIWSALGFIVLIAQRIPAINLVVFIAIALLSTLAGLSFFVPIIGIHNGMATAKAQYFKQGMAERIKLESQLQHYYQLGDFQNAKIQDLLKQLEIYQAIYPSDFRYPTWPINISLLVGFFTSQILPIFGGIKTISEFF